MKNLKHKTLVKNLSEQCNIYFTFFINKFVYLVYKKSELLLFCNWKIIK